MSSHLVYADILAAAARIAGKAQLTPVRVSRSLNALADAELFFKCENLQRVGAFKFRGACNAVWSLSGDEAARGVITHSSGNHGAALALAARDRGIPAQVVVPRGAVRSKLAAIEAFGATLHECEPSMAAREAKAAELVERSGGQMVHPFTDPRVIAGQGTAALELLREVPDLDLLITPVGGGGLVSGTALAASGAGRAIRVFGAEPEGAADAFASLERGTRVTDIVADTICDGLRGTIGQINLDLMREHRVDVLLVSEAQTRAALRLIFERLKLVVEPSCATVLAAVLRHRDRFEGRRVGLVLSGGNVDLAALGPMLA
jgi:threonine dehydratase